MHQLNERTCLMHHGNPSAAYQFFIDLYMCFIKNIIQFQIITRVQEGKQNLILWRWGTPWERQGR